MYEATPSALRSRRRAAPTHAEKGSGADAGEGVTVSLRLPARPPFDGVGLLRFFADHAVPGLEVATPHSFTRRVRLPHGVATVRLSLDGADWVRCEARLDSVADVSTLVSRVRKLLDLDADSVAIDAALAGDATLAPLVAALPGLRLPGSLDAEETLFRTLVGQQISVPAARTVLGRITRELGEPGRSDEQGRSDELGQGDDGMGLFPTAERIAGSVGVIRGPLPRVRSILGVAEAVADGRLSLDVGTPVDEFTARLVELPGVGPWTAGYLAMRILGNPDVLLDSDLVVLQSAALHGLPSTRRSIALHGVRWAPWRSYVTMHLWRARASVAVGGGAG